jgi:pSer/pThr/pTyr-binding forkhead associated (FHA) protein/tetratricopeptide (TPR) repeat protein
VSETSSFKLIIEDDEGRRSVVPIDLDSVREGISIGRQEGNTIRLNERNVSRRHARFVREAVGIYAEDLDSYNGVWINGDRIKGRQELHDGDTVRVGDFQLELRGEGLQRRVEETTQRTIVNEGSEVTRPDIRLESAMNGGPLSPNTPGLPPLSGMPMPGSNGISNGAPHAEAHGQGARFESPGSRSPTLDTDLSRPEPTALIRMDRDDGRARDTQILAGQKAKIICVSTQFAGQEFDIDKTEVVIGRTDENDIAIDHRSVSRHHAKVVVNQRSYRIMDLKSANGTLVNGEEYAQTELKRGDLIELGHVKFRFLPPGAGYDFTADELTAMQAAGHVPPSAQPGRFGGQSDRNVTQVVATNGELGNLSAQPTAINQWSDELEKINSKKKMGPLVVAAVSALLVVIVGGGIIWWMQHPHGGRDVKDIPPNAGSTIDPQGIEDLMRKASKAMDEHQWGEAAKLADAIIVFQPSNGEAQDIKRKATEELACQGALDRATRSMEQRNWDEAWRALNDAPSSSSCSSRADAMRSTVRQGRIISKIEETKRAIAGANFQLANGLIQEISDMDPNTPELPSLRDAVAKADRNGGQTPNNPNPTTDNRNVKPPPSDPRPPQQKSEPKEPKPPKQTANPTPPAQTPPKPPTTPTPPPATPQVDSKTYYADGLKELQAGNTEKAIELLDKCVKADTKNGMCYRALGISYARLKNGPKAAKYYRMYLRVMPDAKDAKQVEELLKAYEGAATP